MPSANGGGGAAYGNYKINRDPSMGNFAVGGRTVRMGSRTLLPGRASSCPPPQAPGPVARRAARCTASREAGPSLHRQGEMTDRRRGRWWSVHQDRRAGHRRAVDQPRHRYRRPGRRVGRGQHPSSTRNTAAAVPRKVNCLRVCVCVCSGGGVKIVAWPASLDMGAHWRIAVPTGLRAV